MSKILVIDDEETNVRVLSISLRADGHEVVTAYSGEEGLEVFQRESPDIVLTDIKMPGMSGIDVLEKIKARGADAEVIIITGHGDIENAIEALKYGASDFINKPIRDEPLSIAIRRAEEKLEIRRKLEEYTHKLEHRVEMATRELRRRSNFLARLIGSANDGIVATDRELTVVIFNPSAERLFGWPRTDVIDRMKATDLYPQGLYEIMKAGDKDRESLGELPWKEAAVTARDGTRIPVRFAGTALYENNVMMGSVAFFQDLREIKRLERELIRSERLAAVGQTVAGMAHGIKNILHGFKGGSYLVDLGIRKNDADKLKNGWEMIKRNITRTSDLVLDLLSYSKERDPEVEACLPNEIAGDVCELLQETARENRIEIVEDFDPSIGRVSMDPRIIHRALLNLMSNGLDACIFDPDTEKHWQVRLKTALDGDAIRFEVADNGIGMREEVKEKLFTSFFSTKGNRGTGLGLLVTRKLIEEHHGSIHVFTEPGKGTAFTVRIPYEPAEVMET